MTLLTAIFLAFRRPAATLSILCVVLSVSIAAHAADIQVKLGLQTRVIVTGEFLVDDADRFKAKVAQLSNAMVVLDSPGGAALAGIEIGREIRKRRFDTLVERGRVCTSACAIAWLGGNMRFLERGGQIGFHAAFIVRDGEPIESPRGNAWVRSYLAKDLGLSDEAIFYITKEKPTSILWLNCIDARLLGIFVRDWPILNDPIVRPLLRIYAQR